MEETVVTFKNGIRSIAVYLTYDNATDELNYEVDMTPEIKKEESPDLPTLLWGMFMNTLTNTNNDKTPTE